MPSEFLNLHSVITAFDDVPVSSNPNRTVNWKRSISGLVVDNIKKEKFTVDPSGSLSVFNGTRATSINNLTDFTFAYNTNTTRYRFTWAGAGANPAFRTDRSLTTSTHTLTWAVNTNSTVTLSSSLAGDFTAVLVGDVVFVPGVSTGDAASPFNSLNEGYWEVLSKDITGTILNLKRPEGTPFTAFGQAVLVVANSQLQAFGPTGVQVGDKVSISLGFPSSMFGIYAVLTVNPIWFEVFSTKTLPVTATGIPTTSGIAFFTAAKRYVKIEADQECLVRANGDTGDTQAVCPWLASDETMVAEYVKTGPMWSLTVVNKATVQLEITVISAE